MDAIAKEIRGCLGFCRMMFSSFILHTIVVQHVKINSVDPASHNITSLLTTLGESLLVPLYLNYLKWLSWIDFQYTVKPRIVAGSRIQAGPRIQAGGSSELYQ